MPYSLENRLVVGLASSALFDLSVSDEIFRAEGEKAYRVYQRDNQNNPLAQGVAFPFIKRLLSLNEINKQDPPVEVVLLSRNDPDTGFRVMNSIKHYNLDITRAIFLQGRNPHRYISALSISLFLSANLNDVREAVRADLPAGQVLDSKHIDLAGDDELRIAFDFDGVVADDQAETVYHNTNDLDKFHEYEMKNVDIPHDPGPLKGFLQKLSAIQKMEEEKASVSSYVPKLRISIVTARSAPSHERVIKTMRSWGVTVNEAFFLGGIEKHKILEVLDPHMFFDDQRIHLDPATRILPSVHIPFGIKNK